VEKVRDIKYYMAIHTALQ